jgi:hypothetical protein
MIFKAISPRILFKVTGAIMTALFLCAASPIQRFPQPSFAELGGDEFYLNVPLMRVPPGAKVVLLNQRVAQSLGLHTGSSDSDRAQTESEILENFGWVVGEDAGEKKLGMATRYTSLFDRNPDRPLYCFFKMGQKLQD